jgi:hypothetical protein
MFIFGSKNGRQYRSHPVFFKFIILTGVAYHDQEVDALLNKVSRLDQPSDILAEISRQAKSRLTSSAPSPPPPEKKEGVAGGETEPETDVLNVAETMRRSGHLWMKIASKYAVEVVEICPKAGSPAAGSPAAHKKQPSTATPGAGSGMPHAAAELEAQRQKLVEVRSGVLNITKE